MTDTDHVRHMEEASVAGESPDRSKQRESSAEPTSGSASPVPEARSSAPDPRLAVARESVSLGGVDTATRIFSVRDLPKSPEKADESPAERETAPEDTEPADEAPEAAETAPEAAETVPEAAEDAEDADTGDTADSDGGSEDSAEDAGEGPRDSDEGSGEAGEGSRSVEGSGDADKGSGEAEEGSREAEEGSRDSVEGSGDADEGSGDPDKGDEAAAEGDARLRDAVAAWVSKADGDTDEPGAEAKGDAPEAAPEAAVADEEPSDDEGPGTDPRSDDDDQAPGAEAKGDEPEAAAEAAEDDEEPPLDQPTAVFKAPRPPVDQPTTMLKLGKAAPEPESEPKPKPEAEAERTSKFVALKPLDEPRARPKAEETAAVPQVGPERTTQQPLPPKPPLDLLAELTNTPPPPPSPLRTVARRFKIWTPLVLLLIVVFAIVQSLRPLPAPTLSLTAEESYTFDGSKVPLPWPSQGQGWMDVDDIGTMGDFGKQTPVAIGSVAKAMTAYLVLKDHPLKSGEEGAKITVDALAEKEGGYNKQGESTLNTVKQGDVLTERQAIAAIMIPSANNIARLLARWDAGSEAAFIKKMNDAAKELGMKNTTYTDASGLKETTVSSAEDQVKLGNELVKIPALMEITSMGQWIDPSGQKWYNYNYLVPYTGIGIKTGTTSAAGGNLLFAARKKVGGETVTVVGAILGQHKAPIIKTVNDVSKVALLAAEDALTSTKILKKGDVVGYVDDGLGGHTPVVLTKDVTAVGWSGLKVKLSFAADEVPHTAKAGTKVGTLTVGDSDGGAVTVPVTLQKDLTEPGFADKLTRIS